MIFFTGIFVTYLGTGSEGKTSKGHRRQPHNDNQARQHT